MVPLGALVHDPRDVRPRPGRCATTCIPSADINGSAAPGRQLGPGDRAHGAARAGDAAARDGLRVDRADLPAAAGRATPLLLVFPLAVVLVFLVLAAQYESWSLPLASSWSCRCACWRRSAGVWLTAGDINIFTQIGFVVLVGLACKNAILIVEFAKELEHQGRGILDATLEACRLRLRPILMTSFAFILGVVPLVIATGAGAGDAAGAGHGGVRRHARRDALRHLPDAGLLRRGTEAREPASADGHPCIRTRHAAEHAGRLTVDFFNSPSEATAWCPWTAARAPLPLRRRRWCRSSAGRERHSRIDRCPPC